MICKFRAVNRYTRVKICNLNDHCHDDCNFVFRMIGPYTREKIRNLNDHCNDDCSSSLECEFSRERVRI